MNAFRAYLGQATLVLVPVAITLLAFTLVWTKPGEEQHGLVVLTLIPIVILGFPLNLLGYAVVSFLAYLLLPLPDPMAPAEPWNWRDIAAIVGFGIGAIANTAFIVRRFGFRKLLWATSILAALQVLTVAVGW
jgi:hypothetical protein